MKRQAKFNLGDTVMHKRQGYRAVVVDIDALFQASGQYNPRTCKQNFANRNPWYRLLVDSSNQSTYVEESLLTKDLSGKEIDNPNIDLYLTKDKNQYSPTIQRH